MQPKIASTMKHALRWAALAGGILALSPAVDAQEPYKIGGVLCTSGPFAAVGIDEMRGAQLAVKNINAAGGVNGRKLELIAEDDQGRADLSVIRANKLVSQDKVSAIIACYGAGAVAYAEMLQKAEVPLFGIIGSAALTQLDNPYIFRSALGDPTILEGITDLIRKRGKKRVALIHQSDTMGVGAAAVVIKAASAKGYEIVADEGFAVQANLDLTPQMTRIRAKNPEALVLWAGAPQSIVTLKSMQLLGMKGVEVYGTPQMTSPSVVAAAADSEDGTVIIPDVINHANPESEHANFAAAFKTEYGVPPTTSFAMAGHDSILLIAEALKNTNGEGAKIKANAEKITNFKGLMGTYSYSPTHREGLTASSIKFHAVRGGKLVPVQ